jgi:hypothetical protein
MSVSCSIYRSNRVTPLYTMLHFTCLLLGRRLKAVVDDFWATSIAPDLQFKPEIDRFGMYLKRRLADGTLIDPYLDEVLEFDLAVNSLQFLPRARITEEICEKRVHLASDSAMLNPLIRIVCFRHDPAEVLDRLLQREQSLPNELPEGEFFVLLDGAQEDINLIQLEPRVGAVLFRIQADPAQTPPLEDVDEFVRAGWLLCKL